MNLSGLVDVLREQPAYRALLRELPQAGYSLPLGLIRSARALAVEALAAETQRPILLVAARQDTATNLTEQLVAWSPGLRVLTYSEPCPLFYERAPWGPRAVQARLEVLADLSEGSRPGTVIVTTARALMQRTLPPEQLASQRLIVALGKTIPEGQSDALIRRWLHIGYEPAAVVTEAGQFSRRGGILDIFPATSAHPVRIELWGDEVESLRRFDPASQRSLDTIQSVEITPTREALPINGPSVASILAEWFRSKNQPKGSSDHNGSCAVQ